MSYLPLLLSLLAVDLLAAMSPGPNFVLVTQTAIRRSSRSAGAVVLGFVTSNFIWCFAVAFGLSALFDLAPWLYRLIKLAGGAYLIYLGLSMWRTQVPQLPFRDSSSGAYIRGLLTNLANPKSIVYFGSIFAVFLAPGTPAWVQAVAITVVIVDTVLWYGTVALLFSRGVIQKLYGRAERWINRIAGAVMAAFGARLILARD